MFFESPQALNNVVPLHHQDPRAVVFIDSRIVDCEKIAQNIISTARVFIIGSNDDGVREISKILHESNCLEVHIFGSSCPGCIYLGNTELSLETLTTYELELRDWFKTNNCFNSIKSPHLWLHSSYLNVGYVGKKFVAKINQVTQAKIHILTSYLDSNILNY